jgi:hypothetical protein
MTVHQLLTTLVLFKVMLKGESPSCIENEFIPILYSLPSLHFFNKSTIMSLAS